MHGDLNEMFGHKGGDYKNCSVERLRTKKWKVFGNGFVISNTCENGISVKTRRSQLVQQPKQMKRRKLLHFAI